MKKLPLILLLSMAGYTGFATAQSAIGALTESTDPAKAAAIEQHAQMLAQNPAPTADTAVHKRHARKHAKSTKSADSGQNGSGSSNAADSNGAAATGMAAPGTSSAGNAHRSTMPDVPTSNNSAMPSMNSAPPGSPVVSPDAMPPSPMNNSSTGAAPGGATKSGN